MGRLYTAIPEIITLARSLQTLSDHRDFPDGIDPGDQLILCVQSQNFRVVVGVSADNAFDQGRPADVIPYRKGAPSSGAPFSFARMRGPDLTFHRGHGMI